MALPHFSCRPVHEPVTSSERARVAVVPAANDASDRHARGDARLDDERVPLP